MNTLTDLIDRYIATWNEADGGRRRDLIAQTWSEGASYLDPMLQGEGREGIDAMIVGVQEKLPGPSVPPHRRGGKPPRPGALHVGACAGGWGCGGEGYRLRCRRAGQPAAGDHRVL